MRYRGEFEDETSYAAGLDRYLADAVPDEWRTSPQSVDPTQMLEFERALYATPWFGVWWPESVGGLDLPRGYQIRFERSLALAAVPDRIARMGQGLLLPTLLNLGTDEQIQAFGPDTFSGKTIWCQGFSEPGAGSDLASLRTRATPVDGGFTIDGQKIWTTLAHYADRCFLLARVDATGDKHDGLVMLLPETNREGLERRPIRQINGHSDFCEVFFESVWASDFEVLGGVGDGWAVAMNTLTHERSNGIVARQIRMSSELRRLASLVRLVSDDSEYPLWLDRLGAVAAEARVLQYAAETMVAIDHAGGDLGVLGSTVKLYWSEAHQRLAALGREVSTVGHIMGRIDDQENEYWLWLDRSSRAETIYAGASEVQRDIVAKRGLGLRFPSMAGAGR